MLPKMLSLFCLGIGVFVLVQIIMPVASFKLWEISLDRQNMELLSPDPKTAAVLGVSVESQNSFPAIISNNNRTAPLPYKEFKLSIPSLKLEDLKVIVESNDFDQNLAQLPGTALPGERGNVFITGHSSLPQFFRPGNYKAIFAHLPDVKKGDEIEISAGAQNFKYTVQSLKIVDPKETWVINPPDNQGRYLTLMTCVPPGLYLKRLIILAKL